ncbi:acyl-CoA dehydrogenase family protein [Streptomyces sp. AA0539]|uniref:acyl-CoA dehydrogenase family protein n=1 Tax=Streptomyces sp. AA0539 TaxID=1210045 RepID=UPI00037A9A7B|nr:acyl-CoA dehydrogenase [Streptomyces sp. AA0539]
MTDQQRLRELRESVQDASDDLRGRALAIDRAPGEMAEHLESPAYMIIRRYTTPPAHRQTTAVSGPAWADEDVSCLASVVRGVELARGDAGAILACPGPSLAGLLVRLIGDASQQKRFFGRVADGRTWSFFGMTEPGRGNDATALETRLERDGDGWLLFGAKRYIGNGARGDIGVVFARTGPSPLAIRAVLIEPDSAAWKARALDMTGLRGAYVSELTFDGVRVNDDMLLGAHLPPTRRGMWGAMQVFNWMRTEVAAAALGTALALIDYVAEHRAGAPGVAGARRRAEALRSMVYQAAARIDRQPERGYPASVAKLTATKFAVEVSHWACRALGPAALVEHPFLEKWRRDVCSFEFMEGTGNIQRLHVAGGYRAGATA